MKLLRNIPWPRILAEGVVIVVSILLAFSIDAWWDRQQESEQETLLLESLLADLRALQESRQSRDPIIDGSIEAAQKLLETGRSPEETVTDVQIDFLLNDLTWRGGGMDQGSHIIELLFTSGELAKIQSNELRGVLVDLRFSFAAEVQEAERELAFMENHFYPFLDSNASITQIFAADDGPPGYEGEYDKFPVKHNAAHNISHRDLITDRQFQNLLDRRIMTLLNVKGWEDKVYDTDAQIRAAIRLIEDILAE